MKVTNHYECDACQFSWMDDWHCACDEECPTCKRVLTPFQTDEHKVPPKVPAKQLIIKVEGGIVQSVYATADLQAMDLYVAVLDVDDMSDLEDDELDDIKQLDARTSTMGVIY